MNPDGTSDLNLRVFTAPEWSGRTYIDRNDIHGEGYTAAIKCTTQLRQFTANFGTVNAGSENAADINDRSEVAMTADKWVISGSKYGFTVKGASRATLNGLVEGYGKECDVDLGNYSDQMPRGNSSAVLNLKRADGSPIRVRCLQADKPTLVDGSGPYVFVAPDPSAWWHDLFIELFLLLRRNRIAFT